MNITIKNTPVLKIIARSLAICFGLFLSIFALDVFSETTGFINIVLELIKHLIPAILVLFIAGLSWKREWIGGICFTGLGLLYSILSWNKFHYSAILLIGGSLILLGILYGLLWLQKTKRLAN